MAVPFKHLGIRDVNKYMKISKTGIYKPSKELKISEWPLDAAIRLGEQLGIWKEAHADRGFSKDERDQLWREVYSKCERPKMSLCRWCGKGGKQHKEDCPNKGE
jgi:hypothetical protein